MAISIEFWRSSDKSIDVQKEFNDVCNGFPDKRDFFEATLVTLAQRAARGELTAGTFLLQGFIFEMLKMTALPDEVRELANEFEQEIQKLGYDKNELKVRVQQIGKPWVEYLQTWTTQPIRRKLKDLLRILLTFRPPRESYAAYVPFESCGFSYEFLAKFDVERDGKRTRVVYWRIEA